MLFALISQSEKFICMAFFIIPVSLSSTEVIIILIVILFIYLVRRFPGFFSNLSRALRNFADAMKEDK